MTDIGDINPTTDLSDIYHAIDDLNRTTGSYLEGIEAHMKENSDTFEAIEENLKGLRWEVDWSFLIQAVFLAVILWRVW